jgi:hypothetical protein
MDAAAVISCNVLVAAGVKLQSGEPLTLRDMLGRDPVSLIPPRELTETEQEEQEWNAERQAEKNYKAQMLIYQTQLRRAQREGQAVPEIEG